MGHVMATANRTGRTKTEPFIRLHRGVTSSEAWKSLTCEARCLLLEIWGRHNGQNNGRIPFSHREARKALKIGARKVANALHALQDRGFLIARSEGSFDWKVHLATEWEITTEACDNEPAKKLYKQWPKIHFTVTTVGTHGDYGSDRQGQNSHETPPNGDYRSDREPQNGGIHGDYGGYTSNIPREGETSP